jgi:hypothetical protein
MLKINKERHITEIRIMVNSEKKSSLIRAGHILSLDGDLVLLQGSQLFLSCTQMFLCVLLLCSHSKTKTSKINEREKEREREGGILLNIISHFLCKVLKINTINIVSVLSSTFFV